MEKRPFVANPKPRQPRRAPSPYRAPDPPIAPFWPEKSKKEKEAERKERENNGVKSILAVTTGGLAAAAVAGILSSHPRVPTEDYFPTQISNETRAETPPREPVQVRGFERGPLGTPSNEEVAMVEQSILPAEYGIPVRLVTVGDAPVPMPPEYGLPGNEDAHCDTGRQEIVVGPQVVARLYQQPGVHIYNTILFHESGHAFNWNNAPSLTQEQRRTYRATFLRHIQDGTPLIPSAYVNTIRNRNRNTQLEYQAVEYQAELTQAILSLPFPEYQTGTWDEAVATKLHEIHHIPLLNARFEVRLFRWMIELVFPGRTPETMHREVQAATQRVVEQASYRVNTTILHQNLSPDLQQVTDQAFTIPTNETWLRHYAETAGNSPSVLHHRHSVRRELLQQQADRLAQTRHEIERRSEDGPLVIDFFNQVNIMGRDFHHNRVPTQSALQLNDTYQRLSPHDRQVVQYYLPTYGQLLQYKPSLYQISPTLAQAAHTSH